MYKLKRSVDGIRSCQESVSRRVLLPKIYVTANLDFFIFNFYFNRKLENKKHFLDMPAVSKSWSRRAVFTVICE